jgi:hypothetical protein
MLLGEKWVGEVGLGGVLWQLNMRTRAIEKHGQRITPAFCLPSIIYQNPEIQTTQISRYARNNSVPP